MTSFLKTFLVCDSDAHADFVDHLVMARLQDVDGAQGSSWSGVFTDGTRYGVLWDSPVAALFGVPEDDPSLVLVTETLDIDGVSDWYPLPSPDPEPPAL